MRSRAPTMKEVAAAAGFAPATMSLALRNHHSLPAATRQRIWAVARQIGYRRVGLVVSREMSDRLEDRWLAGYLLEQQRLPPAQRVRPLMPDSTAQIRRALPGWHAAEKPDAVLFGFFALNYQAQLPRTVGIVPLSVYDRDGPLTGIFQNAPLLGATAVDHVVGRLQRGDFATDETSRLHLIAGRWAPGPTAPGPGQPRESVMEADLRCSLNGASNTVVDPRAAPRSVASDLPPSEKTS